jgi:YjbE family integral membrane protein
LTPELLSPPWFSALLAIVLIDLVLAGDNAIVIGLAARHVPAQYRRRVVIWGTAGAVLVRTVLTLAVVWLLKIPAFLLIGGLALIYIGWKLTHGPIENVRQLRPASTVRGAVQTIIVADAVMGLDNVLAIGGAAQGSFLLVVTGFALSIPIVIWGSTLVLKWVKRVPAIIWLGAAVVGWTSAKMIASEPLLKPWFDSYPLARTLSYIVIIGGLVLVPMWQAADRRKRAEGAVLAFIAFWLAAWGWMEDSIGVAFDPLDRWQWDDAIIELVRWIGWIPIALWIHAKLTPRPHRREKPDPV